MVESLCVELQLGKQCEVSLNDHMPPKIFSTIQAQKVINAPPRMQMMTMKAASLFIAYPPIPKVPRARSWWI